MFAKGNLDLNLGVLGNLQNNSNQQRDFSFPWPEGTSVDPRDCLGQDVALQRHIERYNKRYYH